MSRERSYTLRLALLDGVTQVVNELQIFLERTSALIPERTSFFKVDPRDTFLILRESSDISQLRAAWMGLVRRLTLAQENLEKYERQYRSPLQGENIEMSTSPVSTDIGIYEAIEEEGDANFCMKYIYENVPHHQDQIRSPELLRDGSSWSSILSPPENTSRTSQTRLPPIAEQPSEELGQKEQSSKEKGKRRITDEFISPPSSPRVLNVGYGTPFKSSLQFFVRPGGISLPPPEVQRQQNVLVGLALPQTPAFESIPSVGESCQPQRTSSQFQSQPSNPFEGRPLPPHMSQAAQDEVDYTLTPANRQSNDTSRDRYDCRFVSAETRSDGESSQHRQLPNDEHRGNNNGGQAGHPGGDPDGDDDNDSEGNNHSHRGNTPYNGNPHHSDLPPNHPHGGGGGDPGGGGGNGPNGGNYQLNLLQSNIPYGNLVATIRNELKQDQLLVWDGNKDTAIEYFWKVQQSAALEGDIPVALGYWLWKSLKENSRIWMWFTTLPFSEQTKMRTHYLHYLKGIKDNYLGRTWQISMSRKYESQSFRQEGYERESPPAFIMCRIMYMHMLVASDDGGPTEVYLVMQKAPISWGPILNLETVRSVRLSQ